MKLVNSAFAGVLCAGAIVMMTTAAQGAECQSSRTMYISSKNVERADVLIQCLDAVIGIAAAAAPPSGVWRPSTFVGPGSKPGGPNYHELEEYLQWMFAQFEWAPDQWTLGLSGALPSEVQVVRPTADDQLQLLLRGSDPKWTEPTAPDVLVLSPLLLNPATTAAPDTTSTPTEIDIYQSDPGSIGDFGIGDFGGGAGGFGGDAGGY